LLTADEDYANHAKTKAQTINSTLTATFFLQAVKLLNDETF